MKIKNRRVNPLLTYFENNKGGLIHKWMHYFDIYDRHFQKFRGGKVTVLEFGVSHGGSLQMWKKYFGKKARIIGVDINPECSKLAEKQIEVYIGSQEDKKFLKGLMRTIGPVDIVIDDGGHTVLQQNTTFDIVYRHVNDEGVYLVEDLHTNYWKEFGGGIRKPGTFVERSKGLVDQLYAWYSRDKRGLKVDDFTRSTRSIQFYDSIIVFERGHVGEPSHQQKGTPTLSKLEKWDYKKDDKQVD